jgi:alpha-beta hydrolase superfamily lysophospholipase
MTAHRTRVVRPHLPPPIAPASVSSEQRNELSSWQRAMPMQRLLGNGLEWADAREWHQLVDQGVHWVEAGEWLGDCNLHHAQVALAEGHRHTAVSYYYYASACYRFAQAAIPTDTDKKRSLYRKLVEAFDAAGSLSEPSPQKLMVPYRSGFLCGRLFRPANAAHAPIVIEFGGIDGWREEYWPGAQYLLKRGMAVLLLDGPGQGETRLFQNIHLEPDFEAAFVKVITHLTSDLGSGTRIGIWGNSMGGFIAAAVASHLAAVHACCVNGGTIRPAEILDRYPRYIDRVQALLGIDDPTVARNAFERMDVNSRLKQLSCPLLQLHSMNDQVFLFENARRIHDEATSRDKTLVVWPKADHCIYDHSHEKHCLIADWFQDRLVQGKSHQEDRYEVRTV